MTNDAAGNAIAAFERDDSGLLYPLGTFATGGLGSGSGLGSAYAVAFDAESNRFFVVNAGDNTVSMLQLLSSDGALDLLDVEDSGGTLPVSVTVNAGRVFVVNQGNAAGAVAANIAGFSVDDYDLTPIANSNQPLASANPTPTTIQFSPDGAFVIVTEKTTDMIDTFAIAANGSASAALANPSVGQTPFGFVFNDDGIMLVSEAFGGTANASAVSSYTLGSDGHLTAVSSSVGTQQTAACWMSQVGPYAWAANTGSNNVTGYNVASDGTLSLLDGNGVSGVTGDGASDSAVSSDGKFLYVLNSHGSHTVSSFSIADDGSLTKLPDVALPAGAVGLIAR
jgi:6-phosphogluconolactonase (cycloisomerase 2 family)